MPAKLGVWDGTKWVDIYRGPSGGGVVTPPPGNGSAERDALAAQYGSYEPGLTTTGPWSDISALTELNSPTTDKFDIPAGDYENVIIYGDVKPPASGVVNIRNFFLPGGTSTPTSDTGIVSAGGAARGGKINLYDGLIEARVPKNGRNGILGRQWHAERVRVAKCTDAFGSYSTIGPNTLADTMILACMATDLLYTYPDPATSSHADGAHTDCWQHQGGHESYCMYSSLWARGIAQAGTGTNPEKPWLLTNNPPWANGACVIIQNNTGAGIGSTVQAVGNWTRGGLSHYNIKSNAAGCVVRDGKVYRETAVGTGHSGYWGRLDPGLSQTSISGITTLRWIDGPYAGQLLTFESRDRGLLIG